MKKCNLPIILSLLGLGLACSPGNVQIDPAPNFGARLGKSSSDTSKLTPLDVYVPANLETANKKIKQNSGVSTTFNQNPCSGSIEINVSGLTTAQAVELTNQTLTQSNPCVVIWGAGTIPEVTVTAKRTPVDNSTTDYQYTYSFHTSNGTASWVLTGGNGSPGHPYPTLGETPSDMFELTDAESNILAHLGAEARITYYQNGLTARNTMEQLQSNCPQRNIDGNGNAMLHAYWTALNERSFGYENAYKLVVAHEAHNNNRFVHATMDIFNDDLGLPIARQNPNATDGQLFAIIDNRVSTGHGKRIVDEVIQRTTFNICE